MQFWTEQESIDWIRGRLGNPDTTVDPLNIEPSADEIVFFFDGMASNYGLANAIVSWFEGFQSALMLIDDYGIWASSENNHLYYRLRNSYGDGRLLHQAPGHFFLDYEVPDFVTFLELAMQFGWGGHIMTFPLGMRLRFSHDEWFSVSAAQGAERDKILADLKERKIDYRIGPAN